jgi:hypothetical protein
MRKICGKTRKTKEKHTRNRMNRKQKYSNRNKSKYYKLIILTWTLHINIYKYIYWDRQSHQSKTRLSS